MAIYTTNTCEKSRERDVTKAFNYYYYVRRKILRVRNVGQCRVSTSSPREIRLVHRENVGRNSGNFPLDCIRRLPPEYWWGNYAESVKNDDANNACEPARWRPPFTFYSTHPNPSCFRPSPPLPKHPGVEAQKDKTLIAALTHFVRPTANRWPNV